MIKLTVLYPNTPDGRFDLEYYTKQHVPQVLQWCGDAVKGGEIERGIAGLEPGSPAPYRITAHMIFDSTDALQRSFGRYLPEIVADLPNFTNIQPVVQISEVVS